MNMAALPDLITVEQFRNLPDDGRKYELHYGEVVPVGYPKKKHYRMQERLVGRLKARLARSWQVGMEFSYRPLPQFEFRCADVAVVSEARWAATDDEDNLRGAPELVIEVKSPSNTKRELAELASLCLANGSIEFWVVDLDSVSVTVIHRDGTTSVFGAGQAIPLTAFGGDVLPVEEIFG
jgi:Uma2 family endonuclease